MCEHHHAAKHILCPQCDMLVALPRLSHGQKAACPRCGATLTTEWDAPYRLCVSGTIYVAAF